MPNASKPCCCAAANACSSAAPARAGSSCGGLRVPAVVGRVGRRRVREPRVVARPGGGRGARGGVGARERRAQRVVVGEVRLGAAGLAVAQHDDVHGHVVDGGGLGRPRAREARQQRALARDRHLRLARRRARARARPARARSRDPDLHVAKARRRGAVRHVHRLPGLALAAVRQAPEPPLGGRADGVERAPEARRDARRRRGCAAAGRARRRGSRGRPRRRTGTASGGRRSTTSGCSRRRGRGRSRRSGRRASPASPGLEVDVRHPHDRLAREAVGARAAAALGRARSRPPTRGWTASRAGCRPRSAACACRRRPRRPSRTSPGRRATSRRR